MAVGRPCCGASFSAARRFLMCTGIGPVFTGAGCLRIASREVWAQVSSVFVDLFSKLVGSCLKMFDCKNGLGILIEIELHCT